jgi:transcriptional regulator EpsA
VINANVNPTGLLDNSKKDMGGVRSQHRHTTWLDECSRGIDDRALKLDAQDGARFIALLSASRLIRRQGDLIAWLKDAQHFLPHQVLIAAWGDFQRWNVKGEVVSHLPGVRFMQSRGCALDDVLREAYAQWLRGGREPLVLSAAAIGALHKPCTCPLHATLRNMRALLVHGVRDKLSGCDSLYVALDLHGLYAEGERSRFAALAHLLLCQLDSVWRRLAAFRLDNLPAAQVIALPRVLELSARERQILMSLSRGSTNHDIAEALTISLFTVKNHVKRIFRKIGVSNRTQAAARFNQEWMRSQILPPTTTSGSS